MCLSHLATIFRLRFPCLLAAAIALIAPALAEAQTPRLHPETRGYQSTQAIKQAAQQRARATSQPTVSSAPRVSTARRPAAMQVTVEAPRGQTQVVRTTAAEADGVIAGTRTLTIRGPDGGVRTFPVEGGSSAIVIREYIVNPGEALTIVVNPTAPSR